MRAGILFSLISINNVHPFKKEKKQNNNKSNSPVISSVLVHLFGLKIDIKHLSVNLFVNYSG